MSVVANTEAIIQEVGRWLPADIAFVRRVSFDNCDGRNFDLILEVLIQPRPHTSAGWPDLRGRFWQATLLFRRVQNLKLTVCGPWDLQTPGFALDDIRDRQWEGQNLLVSDYEGLTRDSIQFGAHSAEVLSCRPAAFPPHSPGIWREYPGTFPGAG